MISTERPSALKGVATGEKAELIFMLCNKEVSEASRFFARDTVRMNK